MSAGRANRFGHPAADVVRRYLDAGATVFNTAVDGATTLVTDGHTVEMRSDEWTAGLAGGEPLG